MNCFVDVGRIYREVHRLGYTRLPLCIAMERTLDLFVKVLPTGIAHFDRVRDEKADHIFLFFKQNNSEKSYEYEFPANGLARFWPLDRYNGRRHIFATTDEAVEHLIATLAAQ